MRDLLRAFAPATLALTASLGCSTPEALGGPGAPCTLATDCAEGLVCIPQSNNTRQCSNDLAAIQFVEEAGTSTASATQGGPTGGAPADVTSAPVGSASSSSSSDSGDAPDLATSPADASSGDDAAAD
ncbi:MAG TPA: hypothetical protein VEK07_23260 [Polyangiaceae bacterium]|nr:hypothetical protein [Polyangiaceae bacterium]